MIDFWTGVFMGTLLAIAAEMDVRTLTVPLKFWLVAFPIIALSNGLMQTNIDYNLWLLSTLTGLGIALMAYHTNMFLGADAILFLWIGVGSFSVMFTTCVFAGSLIVYKFSPRSSKPAAEPYFLFTMISYIIVFAIFLLLQMIGVIL